MDGSNMTPKKKKLGTMDKILIIIAVLLTAFTVTMIIIFCRFGYVPDTLISAVFATLGGECGVLGWIKTTKDRNQIRAWEIEDKSANDKGVG